MDLAGSPRIAKSGGSRRVTASNDEEFTYRFEIPADAGISCFEYTNITKSGTFRMRSLTYVDFINSRTSIAAAGDFDTISFAGFGSWSDDAADSSHIAAVHVSTSPRHPFVSILIDGGTTSNVNTKPAELEEIQPLFHQGFEHE